MAARSQHRPTAEQRDTRRREQLQQLRQATSALLTSEGWQRWLRTRSRFHRYSLRNTLLIAFQCPHATHVAGFRRWLELGRCVRKGEKGIRIFAPVRYRRREAEDTNTEKDEPELVGFKLAAVFDVSQTDPLPGVEPAPLEPPGQPVKGDSHAHLLGPLEQHAASLAFSVEYKPLDGRDGYCSAREARIVIDSELPANGKVATLVHELAHAHGIDYERFSRPEAELIVESVACIVCGSVGLDTSTESLPYLASWNPDQAVERIELLAGTIDQTARAIERALDTAAAGRRRLSARLREEHGPQPARQAAPTAEGKHARAAGRPSDCVERRCVHLDAHRRPRPAPRLFARAARQPDMQQDRVAAGERGRAKTTARASSTTETHPRPGDARDAPAERSPPPG
jgi:antirestriction protein ArdC